MAVHKIRKQDKSFAFSECGKALHLVGGTAVKEWENTTCKNCLNHMKEAEK